MRNRQASPIVAFIFGAIFSTVGGGLIYFWGWPTIAEAKASRSWPSVPGTITVSRVDSHRDSDNKTMYSHHIEYTFTIDGAQHTGDRVWVGDGWSTNSSSGPRRTVAKYPVGSETTVYYDPKAPEMCALQIGTTWMTYLPFAFGGVFFLVGGLVVVGALLKILAAGFMIGAAATTVVGQALVPTSQNYSPPNDLPHPPADGDDGIDIG